VRQVEEIYCTVFPLNPFLTH
jgi:hypothetical protein